MKTVVGQSTNLVVGTNHQNVHFIPGKLDESERLIQVRGWQTSERQIGEARLLLFVNAIRQSRIWPSRIRTTELEGEIKRVGQNIVEA